MSTLRKTWNSQKELNMVDWTNIRVRSGLVNKIRKFLESDEAKELGLTNPSQVIDFALRELLRQYFAKRFEHINTYEDKVRILDNEIGKSGDIVTVFFKEKSGYCEHDQSTSCVHIKYLWEIPEVAKILKKHGLKPPF